jgi:hypothetical protein
MTNHSQTYETSFPIRSPHGTQQGEIDIQAVICRDHITGDYCIESVFGFELEKNKRGEYEAVELPHYLVEPIKEWLQGSEWANVVSVIEERFREVA